MAYSEEFWTWVHDHLADDPFELRLRWAGRLPWIDEAVMQVECRRRCARKLPEELKHREFMFPTVLSSEQSTSDELAAFHASLLKPGIKVLDMTAGLGIDAFHIAESGSTVTAVDMDPRVADALRHNASVLGLEGRVNAVCADSVVYVATAAEPCDAVFIDPARRAADGSRVFNLADCSPDVAALLPSIFRIAPLLVVKASPMLDISRTLRDLPGTEAIYVTGTPTECKELVAVVSREPASALPSINIWTPAYSFTFTMEEERVAEAVFAAPQSGGYLYEPSEVTMKAAPWRTLSARFGIGMLHPNSHLYCSKEKVDGFPGDRWLIEKVVPFASSELKRFARQYPKINVAVRNFGWTADKLRDKLRVKDGGDRRLMATTLLDGTKVMMVLARE